MTGTGIHTDELLPSFHFPLEMKQSILKWAIYTVPPLTYTFIRNRIKSRKSGVAVPYQVALYIPKSSEGRAVRQGEREREEREGEEEIHRGQVNKRRTLVAGGESGEERFW